jgi:DNA-binding XRE family transcriptional regulator
MLNEQKPTTDGVEILRRRYFEGKPEMMALYEEEKANADIAQAIYDLREEAGLTQKELADLIGTSRTTITRLEDADYEGHSLSMLNRIAAALNKKVQIEFVPLTH